MKLRGVLVAIKNCHKEFHYFYGVKSEHPKEDLDKYVKEGVYCEHAV